MTPSDWIAIAAIGASMVTTMSMVWWSNRTSDRVRRETEMSTARKEAAAIMGPVFVVLVDANPSRWAITSTPEDTQKRADALLAKWEDVRAELAGVSASFPVADVRQVAQELDVALHNAVYSTLRTLPTNPAGDQYLRRAERADTDYAKADAAAQRLAKLLRGS